MSCYRKWFCLSFALLVCSDARANRRWGKNTATGDSFEVQGTIDQKSQRAAWGPVDESWPIMETGIYNLTENEACVLHFEDGQTQEWTMIRLDEPDQSSSGSPN